MFRQLVKYVLLCLALCQIVRAAGLPKLWKADPSKHPDGYYKFFYRLLIQSPNNPSEHKNFLIEEWAHLREARFRFDIVALPENKRRTVLYYADTNETYFYEPFTCSAAADLDQALFEDLQGVFPKNKNSFMKFGIGSLWKYAEKLAPLESVQQESSYIPLEFNSRSTKFKYQATRDYNYELAFMMSNAKNIDTLSLINIGQKYKLRILDTPSELRQQRDQLERVFQLPLGYGCAPANTAGDKGDSVSPKPLQFMSLNPDELRLLRLDFVASRPIDGLASGNYDVPDRWRSHSSSLRIVSGGYLAKSGDYSRNYMIFEKQESVADRRSVAQYLAGVASSRRAGISRTKMVWDMSDLGSNRCSRYYKLDLSEGKCLEHGETSSPLDVGIDLAIAPATSDFDDDSPPLTLALGIELLGVLFSPEGFGLISRLDSTYKDEFVFERRDSDFELKNVRGEVVWNGPVSIIRHITVMRNQAVAASQPDGESRQLMQDRQVITMNFYSKKAEKLLARVKLTVAELRTIDQHFLLDEINVGTCLTRLGSLTKLSGASFVDELPSGEEHLDENLAFEVEYYPLDADMYQRFEASQQVTALRKQIELEFIRSLIELSQYRLDLMQIVKLSVDIRQQEEQSPVEGSDLWSFKITGQLVDKPSLLNFDREPGQKFTETGGQIEANPIKAASDIAGAGAAAMGRQLVRSLLKDDARSCAASCDTFNCTMFTFCAQSNACDLLLGASSVRGGETNNPGIKISWDPSCVLYRRHDRARSIISAHELIYSMGQMVRTQQEQPNDAKQANPLHLKLDYSPSPILLVPESIESNLLRGHEFEQLAELDAQQPADTQLSLVDVERLRSSKHIRQEYSVLMHDRRYKSHLSDRSLFPLPESRHMSHHDCESLCKQNDCMSFSYCILERLCQVSVLHKRKLIEPNIEPDSGCSLMVRDYSTKFEKISLEPVKPQETFETIRQVDSMSDCATECMERESPKCRSFYHCPQVEKGRASCLLKSSNLIASDSKLSTPGNSSGGELTCDLYSRSHLSDFDKFYGKSLPSSDLRITASAHRGLEAESCASECAEHAGDCVGFQVCLVAGSSYLGDFGCTTFSASLKSNIASRLEPNPGCTFFLASPGSEIYQLSSDKLAQRIESARAAAKEAAAGAAQEQSQVDPQTKGKGAKMYSSLAVWSLRILFVAIGSMLGYGMIYGLRESPLMRTTIGQVQRRRQRF